MNMYFMDVLYVSKYIYEVITTAVEMSQTTNSDSSRSLNPNKSTLKLSQSPKFY